MCGTLTLREERPHCNTALPPSSPAQIITPCRKLILCAENRKEMEDWIAAVRSVQNREHFEVRPGRPVQFPPGPSPASDLWPLTFLLLQSTQYSMDHFSGMHNWYACSHARPTYCNVCREALSGVTSHGLSCEGNRRETHLLFNQGEICWEMYSSFKDAPGESRGGLALV